MTTKMLPGTCPFPLPWESPGLPYPTCVHWSTLSCLFSSSLRLSYHCKEERNCFLRDFNSQCNFSSSLRRVDLVCSPGLWHFLVSCSDLLQCWSDLCACVWEGKGDLFKAGAELRVFNSQKMKQNPVLAQSPDVKLLDTMVWCCALLCPCW